MDKLSKRPNRQESQHDESHDRTQGGCGTCSPKNAIYTRHSMINRLCDTGLTSLQTRAERLTACFATKLITRAREGDIKNGLLRALNLNRDVFNKKTWLLCAADAVNRLKLKDTILSKGPDTMSPDYSTPAVFNILQTGTRRAD
ncbi:hypothetical protein Hamer_G007958, partial [Homarus americanus]